MMLCTGAEQLTIEGIRGHLVTEASDRRIYLFSEVSSTNDRLRELAADGALEGSVVVADAQRLGRGRLGKRWFSPPGMNVYASILFRPALEPGELVPFSFIAPLALAEAIEMLGVPAAIKWPNDVLVAGKKVAGTFVNCAMRGSTVDYVILGIGVNVNIGTALLRAALGSAGGFATSLAGVLGHEVDRAALLASWLDRVQGWHLRWKQEGTAVLKKAWADRDILTGRRVQVRGESTTFEGRVLGLGPSGSLIVVDTLGHHRYITTQEVRLHD